MPETKAIYTLNIGMNYAPEICALTYPLFREYAAKIGADFVIIDERQFLEWPIVYEKLQIHKRGRAYDWNIYFDSDCLIHPDLFDLTEAILKDTILQNSQDYAGNRFVYDEYFRRDGRHIGACNWFTVASKWCLDLWKPLDDLTLEEAVKRIHIISAEKKAGIENEHLIDDFVLSRNIARYGLKQQTFSQLLVALNRQMDEYFWHTYTFTIEEKVKGMQETLARWGLI